jgi:hypothetical protein
MSQYDGWHKRDRLRRRTRCADQARLRSASTPRALDRLLHDEQAICR